MLIAPQNICAKNSMNCDENEYILISDHTGYFINDKNKANN